MARHATPLVVAPALPSVDRLEMLVARARLHHQPVGLDPSEEPLLTVLLSFDPTEADRRAARVLAASFITAECSFESAPPATDLGAWVSETLCAFPPSAVCIVIALPAFEANEAQRLGALVESLHASHHYALLIVGVATTPPGWANCGLDGFILAEPGQRVTDTLRVFSMLAALMAPGLMCCLDADDFRSVLGTAANPSKLAIAVYMVGSSCLMPDSGDDRKVMGNAGRVAVMPSRCLPLATLALLVKRTRARLRSDVALTLVAPSGLTAEPLGSGSGVDVLLLCRARVGKPGPTSAGIQEPQ